MQYALFCMAAISGFIGFLTATLNAMQTTTGAVIMLIGAVLFAGGAIVRGLRRIETKYKQQ